MQAISKPPQPKMHDWNILSKKRKNSLPHICKKDSFCDNSSNESGLVGFPWTVWDLAQAGDLLSNPQKNVNFSSEQEMRVIYSLIYDVYRYKTIMNQALEDVGFFHKYPHFKNCMPKVWLLSYDLCHREFKRRESKYAVLAKTLFEKANLQEVEEALWSNKIKLAAAVARLRIKNSALSLRDLLPEHLRNDVRMKRSLQSPVTCWVNIAKVKNMEEIRQDLTKTLKLKITDESSELLPESFKLDKICPFFIIFHSSLRALVAQSHLILYNKLIVQDRSFCLGPVTFSKAISDLELTGSVIQSHVNSPRTTAYLASILSQNQKIKKLMAFSAGRRKQEYEKYFQELGLTNIVLHSERLIDIPSDASYLEEVVAVFATPPNTYSAVSDPIDLVCGRGGDLSMLEVLTETEETNEGRKRVASILEEQRMTLQYAMLRPQIQLVLYETHSELQAENDDMVQSAIKEVNKLAKLQHASLQGKPVPSFSETENTEISNNESVIKIEDEENTEDDSISWSASRRVSQYSKPSLESITSDDLYFKDVVIPETDIFETPKLPDLCPNEDSNINLSQEGCYLSLLKRKQVIQMDNKYTIQMTENRGLFRSDSNTSGKTKTENHSKKKQKDVKVVKKIKRKTKDIEIDRIAAPTQSSSLHARQPPPFKECPRHAATVSAHDTEEFKVLKQSRKWWIETANHLKALRSSLVNKKILPPLPSASGGDEQTKGINCKSDIKIDEFVAKNREEVNKTSGVKKVPVFPKLRLSRPRPKREIIRVPVAVTILRFPCDEDYY